MRKIKDSIRKLLLIFFLILSGFSILTCEREKGNSFKGWFKDYGEALKEASENLKPVFLYYSAVWCSWCREYEKVLSDPEVRSLLSRKFVPLVLDADRDRKLFYNHGGRGTPFTVILDSRGRKILAFHGAMKKEDLIEVLSLPTVGTYSDNRGKNSYRISGKWREDLDNLEGFFFEDLKSRFDPLMGGFSSPSEGGALFKWPTPLTYLYLIRFGALTEEALFSLQKDLEFLWDPVDGGFFNFFDRTRSFDFYFETSKSLQVNSLMILALIEAYRKTSGSVYLKKALKTYDYLKTQLYHKETGCFLNAQVSDPSYYNLPPEKRVKRKPPARDTAIIVEFNSYALIALKALSELKGNGELERVSLRCLKFLKNHLRNGRLYRYYDVETGRWGEPDFHRDIALFNLVLVLFGEEPFSYGPTGDAVSDSILAYAMLLSGMSDEAERILKGLRVNLEYTNPDDLVFLLLALRELSGMKGKLI
jgi:thioredoxin-related protein